MDGHEPERDAAVRPAPSSKAERDRQVRIEREARALRENLRRRKQQMRERETPEGKPE